MTDTIREMERLARLRSEGVITQAEFAALKAKLLSQPTTAFQGDQIFDGSEAPEQTDQKVDAKTSAIVVGVISGLIGLYMIGHWLMSHAVDLFSLIFIFFDIFGPLIALILLVRWINGLVDKLAKSRRNDL